MPVEVAADREPETRAIESEAVPETTASEAETPVEVAADREPDTRATESGAVPETTASEPRHPSRWPPIASRTRGHPKAPGTEAGDNCVRNRDARRDDRRSRAGRASVRGIRRGAGNNCVRN